MKKSFVIYHDSLSILEKLTDEQAGQLFKRIAKYQYDKIDERTENVLIDIALAPFISCFKRDAVLN